MNIYSQQKKILIIKFGGLGDIILSLDAIFSIKKHHNLKTVLLTEKPHDKFLQNSNWFDRVVTIKRSLFYFYDLYQIKKKLNNHEFQFIYDLQTSSRTSHYLKYFDSQRTITNGIGQYARNNHNINKNRNNLHTIERQKDQLSLNNVKYEASDDLSWLYKSNISIPREKYVMIIPGGSGKRVNKRIPINIYKMIIKFLTSKGLKIVIIGSKDEANICSDIESQFPDVINLCNKTNLLDVGKLSTKTELSIGNDTGPIHLASKGGKMTFVFFSKYSEANLCAPRGKNVQIFHYLGNQNNFFQEVLKKIKIKLRL